MWLPTSSSGLGWSPSSPSASTSEARRTSARRSEEHTSELQSRLHLVCRLLLEKKKEFFLLSQRTRRRLDSCCRAGLSLLKRDRSFVGKRKMGRRAHWIDPQTNRQFGFTNDIS